AAAQARGAALLRRAAEAGLAKAQFRYGLLCAHGQAGVAQDPAEAARWCQAAARQGLPVAQYNLALLHAAGSGVDADPDQAARWLRVAAINGVNEAAGCLDLIHGDEERPRTWAEAETRASVALHRTDPDAPKTVRFAEYYVDPCLDLLERRFRLRRDEAEDIVQQFFCELEEPLEKGEHRGVPWKDSLRRRYDAERGSFRPYLSRARGNFARDWLRRREERPAAGSGPAPEAGDPGDPAAVVDHHAEEWRAALAAFAATQAGRPAAARAVAARQAPLGDGLDQAAAAARLGVTDRTVRSDLRLGAELLLEWLAAHAPAGDAPADQAVRRGLALMPDWLHHPGPQKRARALLLLALAWRRRGPG
ncbi:MAG: sel1 repeat family protein, partial [Planctomycetes bacterium]|nr:sel1 repeat family protein [Planctomycetota bacterium]